jgi:predicted transcriptional regulator
MSCMKSRTLTVRLDPALDRELEKVSKATGRSRGELVRDALKRQLSLSRFERLRGRALPFAEAAGLLTDEDVFKLVS